MSEAVIQQIARCNDPKLLKLWAANAAKLGNTEVERAARLRLYAVLPSARPETLAYDVWQSIHALEDALSSERGKTIRLSRTRQKIGRDGETQTVIDLVLKGASEGFRMLIERKLNWLTFEALAIKHDAEVGEHVAEAGRARLKEAGVDLEVLAVNLAQSPV